MRKNNINVELVLFLPLMYLGLFINGVSLIGATITGILALIYLFNIVNDKPIKSIINIIMFIVLYILMLNDKIIVKPILKVIVLLCIIFTKSQKSWIKGFIINSILLFLLNIYYYYREYSTLEVVNFISTILIIKICIYKNTKYLVKWQIKNLSFNNKYFKFTHYLLITFLYFNNAILIKQVKAPESYHITLQSIIVPILIFYVIYIIIYPLIKQDVYIEREKKI